MARTESHWQPVKRWKKWFGQGRIVKTAAEMKAEILAEMEAAEQARKEAAAAEATPTEDR